MQKASIAKVLLSLKGRDNFVFLETKKITAKNRKSYLFVDPIEIVSCNNPFYVKPSLEKVERFIKQGFYAAGFISYEAGFALEEALKIEPRSNFPLLWFGIYKDAKVFDHKAIRFIDNIRDCKFKISGIRPEIFSQKYISAINKIKSSIRRGDTYQVNYTFKLNFAFQGSYFDIYRSLRSKQSVSYSSLIHFGNNCVISFSPELFFRQNKDIITVKPMKGTSSKGRFLQEQKENAIALYNCPKNRSENIMIVDLLRNDLGRICKTNTVKTKKLFEVEDYESLLQMTSTVQGRLKDNLSLYDLFKAIFPSGSVTGAPKIRTMQIINELEPSPRKIYTGSIGFISPRDKAVFNVAIRTVLLDTARKKGEMGIGSGIVYDADAQKEYEECLLKARFLTEEAACFKLIETLLWERERYFLLSLHLERLKESCAYFNFYFDKKDILKALYSYSRRFNKDKAYRARFLLDKEGNASITSLLNKDDKSVKFISFSRKNTQSDNIFLFHKTTDRNTYESEYKKCKNKGFYDIIFKNEKGEVTEGAISNIFIKKGEFYYTPPVKCGLLNGVYRRHFIKQNPHLVKEKVLYPKDIRNADKIFLTNAVRKMQEVRLCER